VHFRSAYERAGQRHAKEQQSFPDGLYIIPAFTPGNAANLVRDLNFSGTIVGNVHAQPLYIEGGPNGPMIIAVTASNNIYALNASTGAVIWQRTDIGPAVTSGLNCGNINPAGTIGTPVVDLASRSLLFDALIAGSPIKHFIFSLNVDTGTTNAGWPVDLNATASYNGIPFISLDQEKPWRTGSCERDRLHDVLRILGRLRQLSWLGYRRGH